MEKLISRREVHVCLNCNWRGVRTSYFGLAAQPKPCPKCGGRDVYPPRLKETRP